MLTPANFPPIRSTGPSFEPRPLPSIARRMNRGASAEMAMLLHLLTINHQTKRLPESKRETLRPF